MKLLEAIARADELRPNAIDDAAKARFVEDIDADFSAVTAGAAVRTFPQDRDLYLQAPFDDVYVLYLCAMIDYYQGDTALFQNDMVLFNERAGAARAALRRSVRPPDAGRFKVM